ncbi:MAG: calcium/sodium antiporter [Litorivicinus sp.]
MWLNIAAVVLGIVALTWSADRFVEGASGVALKFNISPLVIGMTIVAIGTSAPEVLVSIMAVTTGAADIAVGNAVGSNIANIALALGISALITSIPVASKVKTRALPAVLGITALGTAIAWDGLLNWVDGVIILIAGVIATWIASAGHDAEEVPEGADALTLGRSLLWLALGLGVLLLSARLLVWGASELAISLGVPEVLVGLTVVAIGTSLPEVAASVAGALKGQAQIAIGNVIGSNIFNIGGVFAVAGLLAEVPIADTTLHRDFVLMVSLTAAMLVLAWIGRGRIGKLAGGSLIAVYLGYLAFLTGTNL